MNEIFKRQREIKKEIQLLKYKKVESVAVKEKNNLGFYKYSCKSCGGKISIMDKFPVCCNSTIKAKQELIKETQTLFEELKATMVIIKLYRAGFKQRELEASFENFETNEHNKQSKDFCLNFANNFISGKNIILTGKKGTGKTHLISAIIKNILKRNIKFKVFFFTLTNFLTKIKNDFSIYYNYFEDVANCDILIIEDLGQEKLSDFDKQTVFNLINERYRRKKSIFVTTNISGKGITEAIGSTTFSRIYEGASVFKMNGASVRKIDKYEED